MSAVVDSSISEYERQRLENIERNREVLKTLEIDKLKPEIPLPVYTKRAYKRKPELDLSAMEPQRRSARLLNKPVEHKALPSNFSDASLSRADRARVEHVRLKRVPSVIPAPVADDSDIDYSEVQPLPKRSADGRFHFKTYPQFTPNLSPKEVIEMGSFGGAFFRKIRSRVTGETYSNDYKEFPEEWFEDVDIDTFVTNPEIDPEVNKYKHKAGQDLDAWEAAGWVAAQDPRGWFQWYCRFYMGRRSPDDERQVQRWLGVCGPNGRWKKDLVVKIVRSGKRWGDEGVSPTVRQTLQQWAYVLTEKDYNAFM